MISVSIQTGRFDVGAEWTALASSVAGSAGAIAGFCGLVRERFEEQSIETLFLEHYPGMTERSIESILGDAVNRFDLIAARVVHRVGTLEPGEQIVLVLCAATHRHAAFDACEFVMDYLKTKAVFWKREASASESRWVQSTGDDQLRAARWMPDAQPRGK